MNWSEHFSFKIAVIKEGLIYSLTYADHGRVRGTASYNLSINTVSPTANICFSFVPPVFVFRRLAKKFLNSGLTFSPVDQHSNMGKMNVFFEIQAGTKQEDRMAFLAALVTAGLR